MVLIITRPLRDSVTRIPWIPYRKKDIDTLERIQKRSTKIIPEMRDLSYEECLKECPLTTLEFLRY